jgi:hypothetical protein
MYTFIVNDSVGSAWLFFTILFVEPIIILFYSIFYGSLVFSERFLLKNDNKDNKMT